MTKRRRHRGEPLPPPRLPTWQSQRWLEDADLPRRPLPGPVVDALDPKSYPPASRITEEELLRGYRGLREPESSEGRDR
jgi:hypothetical protein